MSTYHINFDGDVLPVGFGKTLATGNIIVGDKGLKQVLIHISNVPKFYGVSGCPDGDSP
jgi:hypothetical protein